MTDNPTSKAFSVLTYTQAVMCVTVGATPNISESFSEISVHRPKRGYEQPWRSSSWRRCMGLTSTAVKPRWNSDMSVV